MIVSLYLTKILDTSSDYILYGDQKQNDMEQLREQINCLEASIKSLGKTDKRKFTITNTKRGLENAPLRVLGI
mgnify:CR=1 FL=1